MELINISEVKTVAKYENPAMKSARTAQEDLVAELNYIKKAHEEIEAWDRQWAELTADGPNIILAEYGINNTDLMLSYALGKIAEDNNDGRSL